MKKEYEFLLSCVFFLNKFSVFQGKKMNQLFILSDSMFGIFFLNFTIQKMIILRILLKIIFYPIKEKGKENKIIEIARRKMNE